MAGARRYLEASPDGLRGELSGSAWVIAAALIAVRPKVSGPPSSDEEVRPLKTISGIART
jgi:hypothetical protein